MSIWIFEPHDAIIVRDGRPFTNTPGARAKTLPFPLPSVTTGTWRTLVGTDATDTFTKHTDSELKSLMLASVHGPLLVSLNDAGDVVEWYVPVPSDIVFTEDDDKYITAHRLVPLDYPQDFQTDLPNLKPVGMESYKENKPTMNVPRFWDWATLQSWLHSTTMTEVPQRGLADLPIDSRTHIRMQRGQRTAEDGALFMTMGLEFTAMPRQVNTKAEPSLAAAQRLGLAVAVDKAPPVTPTFASLGAERRVAAVRQSQTAPTFPPCPEHILAQIVAEKSCRVMLLTPALFTSGYLPAWLLTPQHGVTPQLVAACVNRPQIISGWDYQRNGPKPSRRLAPAGSVFFLKLTGDETAIRTWVTKMWMECVSDDDAQPMMAGATPAQYRLDGFGLAVLGTWNSNLSHKQSVIHQKESETDANL